MNRPAAHAPPSASPRDAGAARAAGATRAGLRGVAPAQCRHRRGLTLQEVIVLLVVAGAGGPETLTASPPAGGVAIVAPPLSNLDMVLLPTAEFVRNLTPATRPSSGAGSAEPWFWWAVIVPGVALGIGLLAIILVAARRGRRRMMARGEIPDLPPPR